MVPSTLPTDFASRLLWPVNLIVPDASWRQTKKFVRREPGLVGIPHVRLPLGPPSEYRLRAQPSDQNLCTQEAIARAIGILACRAAQAELETLLRVLGERTLWSRGMLAAGRCTTAGIPRDAFRSEANRNRRPATVMPPGLAGCLAWTLRAGNLCQIAACRHGAARCSIRSTSSRFHGKQRHREPLASWYDEIIRTHVPRVSDRMQSSMRGILMCELMGMSFDRPISADFSIRAFALRDMENAHGWGLAWYPDQSLAVVKEPLEWRQSSFTQFLENYHGLNSRLYVAHVRHRTTGGSPTRADTHPFSRELAAREFCFAHNGTLADFHELPLSRYRPLGGTDSEHVFCYLLEQLAQRNDLLNDEPSWRWLHQQLTELNRRGKLNCLLSDGKRLFGYHDAAGWKGLSLRKLRIGEGQARHLEDATVEINMQNIEHQAFNHGYVIATCPLSAAGWQSFVPGELIVLDGGTLCFSSHADRLTLRG
ncbi:MAG: class II glutamine amidotransferase [Planctomycetaceae bacterium]|nr:class II glutamine amidotransferase [Planctomycetaceae bacterium]